MSKIRVLIQNMPYSIVYRIEKNFTDDDSSEDLAVVNNVPCSLTNVTLRCETYCFFCHVLYFP